MKDSTRRTLRTSLAALVALASMAPLLVREAGLDPARWPWLATVLAVAAGLTRLMAAPQVEAFLQTYLPWLAKAKPDGEHELGRAEDDPYVDTGSIRSWLMIGLMALLVIASLAFVALMAASAPPADARTRPVEHVRVAQATDCRGVLDVNISFERPRGREWVFREDDGAGVIELHFLGAAAGPGGHWDARPSRSGGEGHYLVSTVGLQTWDAVRVRHAGWTSSQAVVSAGCPA
jgi:hypothetical protein